MAQAAQIIPFPRPAEKPLFEPVITVFQAEPNAWMTSNFTFVRMALKVIGMTQDELSDLVARKDDAATGFILGEMARVEDHLNGLVTLMHAARNRIALVAGFDLDEGQDFEPNIA